jgi:hypothetical protein
MRLFFLLRRREGDSVLFNLRYWVGFWSGLASSAKSKDKKIWSFVSFPVKMSTNENRKEAGLGASEKRRSGSRDAIATCEVEEKEEEEDMIVS